MKSESTQHSFNKTIYHRHCLSNEFIKKIPRLISVKDFIELNKVNIKKIRKNKKANKDKADKELHLLFKTNLHSDTGNRKHNSYSLFSPKEKNDIKSEANAIVNILTSITNETSSKSTRLKMKTRHRNRSKLESKIQNMINNTPKKIELFTNDPDIKYPFQSYDLQMKTFGKERYRDIFFEGVNKFKRNNIKYNGIKLSPLRQEEIEMNNKIINDLEMNMKRPLNFRFKEFPKKTNHKVLPALSPNNHYILLENNIEINSLYRFDKRVNSTLSQAKSLLQSIEPNRDLIRTHRKMLLDTL